MMEASKRRGRTRWINDVEECYRNDKYTKDEEEREDRRVSWLSMYWTPTGTEPVGLDDDELMMMMMMMMM